MIIVLDLLPSMRKTAGFEVFLIEDATRAVDEKSKQAMKEKLKEAKVHTIQSNALPNYLNLANQTPQHKHSLSDSSSSSSAPPPTQTQPHEGTVGETLGEESHTGGESTETNNSEIGEGTKTSTHHHEVGESSHLTTDSHSTELSTPGDSVSTSNV